jgi:ribosomal protein S18 acetylase RimI-like enzyme
LLTSGVEKSAGSDPGFSVLRRREMVFFIRTASERDIEQVRALLARTWHATYDPIYGADKVKQLITGWHSAQSIKERVLKKGGEFLVADDGKRIAGMGYAAMSSKMVKTALLHQLYVDPHFQRQGIGRDIFAELETCFPDAEIMRLEVEPKNTVAIAFYEGVGFAEVDRVERMAGVEGMSGIVMEKTLTR